MYRKFAEVFPSAQPHYFTHSQEKQKTESDKTISITPTNALKYIQAPIYVLNIQNVDKIY